MKISSKVLDLNPSAIHEMTRLAKKHYDVAFLSWAKPISHTPEHINSAAIDAIRNGLTSGYSQSEGLQDLREQISKKLKRDNNISAIPEEIIVTVGAIEGLAASITAIIDPGDEVILFSPSYSTHVTQVKLASGIPVLIPLDETNGYSIDFEKLVSSLTRKTKAIIICTPNNPTGTVFPESDLKILAKIALKNNLMIIIDEAYEYFVYDDHKHFSIASLPEMKDSVISIFTFTKTYAMTGWRIGYLHAGKKITEQIKKVHIPLSICVPVVSQYAALAALKGSQECVKKFKYTYEKARNLMCERLDHLNEHFEYIKPQGSYLMFPKILDEKADNSFAYCKHILEKIKVSATPGIAFGPNGENHIRLSFCVPDEMINKAFDRLEMFYQK